MLSFAIIEDFNVFETGSLHFSMSCVTHAMNPLVLKTVEPALGRGVDAPIRLHHGDGTVIRNNRIIVKEPAPKRAVSVVETGRIALEGNTYYGLSANDDLVKAFSGQAIYTAKSNKYETSWKGLLLK